MRAATDISKFSGACIFMVRQSRLARRGLKPLHGLDGLTAAQYLFSVFLNRFENSTSN